ncbi:TadA family conjugal transfer-associated ATPase [Corynebacterium sp. ES2794-CONJ1]|uniref:TadA family conjugal transfer-associated ATPase n=1 Tax=unclassified Corynebacterium TaxID=2624378 RepID=UPI0021699311|nr:MULTISPECIES: TadA family conjugal transfer-associated ATPase [unclassified Corynebacterium]MCS4490103.1 TadA family conjugal transfer-associated ATPase [Corynebacterium sp. ES2775-CONJ]MCS4532196.1 TadA family conjugal transfer-associated ATPase [Corynebacterium sp. ES2730-CONJ]MCU9519592.1 TadA family conjugal transfer-associated ATPase [Corynebacterium sp. ES2794-CONJ1]
MNSNVAADLIPTIQRQIAQHPQGLTPQEIATLIRAESSGVVSDVDVLTIMRQLRYDTVGLGVLEPLLALRGITDIVVNDLDQVWFDRGAGFEKATVSFSTHDDIRRLATRLLHVAGRRLDGAQSYGDGKIAREDGTHVRIHAILSPPAETSPLISIRVLNSATANLRHLEESGSFPPQMRRVFDALIVARRSFLVVGGTGSGKTTLLGALLEQVPQAERIICIEDTAELKPRHPHTVHLITRAKNTEGRGEIGMCTLLQQALRMRPDRIVIGEIRGKEVIDLLSALNTGHEGSAGTLHANTSQEVPARLEALAAMGGLDTSALHSQLAAAQPVILCTARQGRLRILSQIAQIHSHPPQVDILWDHRRAMIPEELMSVAGWQPR